ncbi:O-antigen ligase family protein [bacterium]|nr:MAG: O-antigen ligase family protein [bacterium]
METNLLNIKKLFFIFVIMLVGLWAVINLEITGIVSLIAFFALLFLFTRNYRSGFIALLFLKPIIDLAWDTQLFSFGSISLNLLKITGFIIPFLCLVYFAMTPKIFKVNSRNSGVLLFIFINLISIFIIFLDSFALGNVFGGLTYFFKLLNGFFIFLALPFVFDREGDDVLIIKTLFYSAITPTILSIFLFVFGGYNVTIGQDVERFAGIYHDAGGLSINAFIGFTVSVFYLQFLNYDRGGQEKIFFKKLFALLLIAANLLFLYLALTRIMYLVVFVFGVMWVIFYYRKYLLVLIVAPLLVLWIINNEDFRQRSWKEFRAIEEYERSGKQDKLFRFAGGGRIYMWQDAFDVIDNMDINQKLFGTGYGIAAHNEYIDIIVRTGFIGFVIFLIMLARLFFQLVNNRSTTLNPHFKSLNLFAVILLLCFCIMSMTGYTVSQTTFGIYIWSILSICLLFDSRNISFNPVKPAS